jgi:hypothetical protein
MKIKTTVLDEHLNEVVNEYDLNELEAESEVEVVEADTSEILEEASSTECLNKTLFSLDLPDGVRISLGDTRILWKRHRVYAHVCFPNDVEQTIKDAINECFQKGIKAALVAAGISLLTPAALAAAAPIAATAFGTVFTDCLGDRMTDSIKFNVEYESHRV